jgi:type VI secretion system secreted protein Hcp
VVGPHKDGVNWPIHEEIYVYRFEAPTETVRALHGFPFHPPEEFDMQIKPVRIALIASAAAVGLSASAGAFAAVDMFLKLDGISGESTNDKHKGESEVLSWSWGASGKENGKKGCVQEMNVTKVVDSASPPLITNAGAGGIVSPKAVLKVQKSGGDRQEFFIVTMTNVRVASYATAASSGSDNLVENVAFSFDQIDGEYKKQKPDGSLDAGIPWNVGPAGGKCQ